jgi:hypothetical protein
MEIRIQLQTVKGLHHVYTSAGRYHYFAEVPLYTHHHFSLPGTRKQPSETSSSARPCEFEANLAVLLLTTEAKNKKCN